MIKRTGQLIPTFLLLLLSLVEGQFFGGCGFSIHGCGGMSYGYGYGYGYGNYESISSYGNYGAFSGYGNYAGIGGYGLYGPSLSGLGMGCCGLGGFYGRK
ncbi:hypothetical protein DINM_000963 [Dirofilaria immitis]|nr:hypothetical protein [Dirofilaria immitis]